MPMRSRIFCSRVVDIVQFKSCCRLIFMVHNNRPGAKVNQALDTNLFKRTLYPRNAMPARHVRH